MATGYSRFRRSPSSSSGGWFEPPSESTALFLRAEHWRALGGWDEGFVMPGGGLVNLDTWARVCADPTGEMIMLLGEATFHQVHGGIATNNLNPPFALFHEEYSRLRGRAFERPTRRPLYFGTVPKTTLASRQLQAVESACRDQVARLSAVLELRASNCERLNQEVQGRGLAQLSERINEGDQLKRQIDSIHGSICWRLTWPIPWLHKLLTRVRGA
jgi:hypothetical protein